MSAGCRTGASVPSASPYCSDILLCMFVTVLIVFLSPLQLLAHDGTRHHLLAKFGRSIRNKKVGSRFCPVCSQYLAGRLIQHSTNMLYLHCCVWAAAQPAPWGASPNLRGRLGMPCLNTNKHTAVADCCVQSFHHPVGYQCACANCCIARVCLCSWSTRTHRATSSGSKCLPLCAALAPSTNTSIGSAGCAQNPRGLVPMYMQPPNSTQEPSHLLSLLCCCG